MSKVGFNEVQAYAKANNVDFKTAAKKMGLSEKDAAELEKLGGDPGAPVDGFEKKTYKLNGKPVTLEHTYTLKSGRQVQVFKDENGKEIFQYKAADGTTLKEEYFKKQEGVEGKNYVVMSDGKLGTVAEKKDDDKAFFKFTDEKGDFSVKETLLTAAKVVLSPLMLLSSCSEGSDELIGPGNITNNNQTVINLSIKLEGKSNMTAADIDKIINAALEKFGDRIVSTLTQLFANLSEENKALNDKILNAINSFKAENIQTLNKILSAIKNIENNGGDTSKIEALLGQILDKLNNMDENQKNNTLAILDAITNIKVGGGDTSGIEALLNKILNKMDDNSKAILDAIANIKVGGGGDGTVDLSTVEAMLQKLIELVGKNGDTLSSIDAKMDVLNITANAILDKLEVEFGKNDERYTNIMNILNAIKNNGGGGTGGAGYDDSALLAKLDKVLDKLDDILDAIKDHKVTVDVTGKVTCDCNCGGNHEGILGDLEDILG